MLNHGASNRMTLTYRNDASISPSGPPTRTNFDERQVAGESLDVRRVSRWCGRRETISRYAEKEECTLQVKSKDGGRELEGYRLAP
jgi:hypothetical protein